MEPGHRDELVQDAPLLGPPALAVSLDDRRHEFIPRRHAHPPHRYLPDPIRVGSISDEATAQHSGTFLARQCGPGRGTSQATAAMTDIAVRAADPPPSSARPLPWVKYRDPNSRTSDGCSIRCSARPRSTARS